MRLISELPGKLRLEETNGRGNHFVIGGGQAAQSRVAADDDDDDLLESLYYDSAEYFFSTASETATTLRYLGGQFRMPTGQTLILYQMVYPATSRRNAPLRVKFYGFDSRTGLTSRVRSSVERGGARVQIETEWLDWRQVDGQRVPGRMRRLENGVERASIVMNPPAFSAATADTTFTRA